MKHYARYSRSNMSACGLSKYGVFRDGSWIEHSEHYTLKLTRTKSKVICKNCKQTKIFKKGRC